MKTSKAKLLPLLEDNVAPLEEIPPGSAWIIDGMVLLQCLRTRPSTFAELARVVLQMIMSPQHVCGGRVDVVFDCYWEASIKSAERQQRAVQGGLCTAISSRNQKCPRQWAKFLRIGANKVSLVSFLVGVEQQ